jgi:hypothetical protein
MTSVRTCLWLTGALILAVPLGAQKVPVKPAIRNSGGLNPNAVTAGGAAFSLAVGGAGFGAGATVRWTNGSAETELPTTSVSSTQLRATVAANLIVSPGSALISVQNPGGALSNSVSLPVEAQVTPGSVPSTLFGMHVSVNTFTGKDPWPAVPFGTLRMWDTGTQWMEMNKAPGVFDFSQLDEVLAMAAANNATDILFTLAGTPEWAATVKGDTSCKYRQNGPGFCQPPVDLNADGSGSDQHWEDFVTAVATHAAGRIRYWEVWNEPSDHTQWKGTVAQLARMASDAGRIIKSIDPAALIVSPAPVTGDYTFMWQFLNLGGASAVDVLALHGYVSEGQPPESVLSNISGIRMAAAESGVSSKPVWDTEGSWGRNVNLPDPDGQAAFLARFYLLKQGAGISRFWWYAWDNTSAGTLWSPSGIHPAGVAYQQVYNWIVGSTSAGPCSQNGAVWTCTLTRAPGYRATAVWDASQTCSAGVCTTSTYIVPAGYIRFRDLTGQSTPATAGAPIHIGARPILLENQ